MLNLLFKIFERMNLEFEKRQIEFTKKREGFNKEINKWLNPRQFKVNINSTIYR